MLEMFGMALTPSAAIAMVLVAIFALGVLVDVMRGKHDRH